MTRTPGALDAAERETIHILEDKGFRLLNIVHASITYQSSDFDLLITPVEQKAWLGSDIRQPPLDPGSRLPINESDRIRTRAKFALFRQRRDTAQLVHVLRTYVQRCIPRPQATEFNYWSVSCMPSTNRGSWPRIACFNMNVMEVFVVGYMKDNPRAHWAFLNVSQEALSRVYPTNELFYAQHPGTELLVSTYEAGGIDQIPIQFTKLDQVARALDDPAVVRAAQLSSHNLMRRRTNFYRRFHCFDLADLLV